jgi:hypothetical protein
LPEPVYFSIESSAGGRSKGEQQNERQIMKKAAIILALALGVSVG